MAPLPQASTNVNRPLIAIVSIGGAIIAWGCYEVATSDDWIPVRVFMAGMGLVLVVICIWGIWKVFQPQAPRS